MKSLLAIIVASLLASTFTSQMFAQWTVQHSGIPTNDQVVLAAVNQNVCWGVTRVPAAHWVTRTTNGGTNWTASNLISIYDFGSIAAVSADTAWIAANGAIYRTTNGGVNWTQQLVAVSMLIVRFFDSNNGVCIGDGNGVNAEIWTTTNKGVLWTLVQSSSIPLLQSEGFIPDNAFCMGNTIWVPTNGGSLYKSTNRGLTWNVTRLVVNQGTGSFCAFKDSLNGLLSSAASNVVKRTTDGGANWTPIAIPAGVSPLFMSYVSGTNGSYMVTSVNPPGDSTGSAYTLDNGATWTTVDNVTHGKAAFVSPSVGWSWGGANVIYKWTGRALPVRDESAQLPDHSELSQNYPNPFNPSTKIQFKVPSSEFVVLKVYDVLGREVKTLVNENLKAGSYETTFDATGLASGEYFYKLEAKDFVSTKKLLLLR